MDAVAIRCQARGQIEARFSSGNEIQKTGTADASEYLSQDVCWQIRSSKPSGCIETDGDGWINVAARKSVQCYMPSSTRRGRRPAPHPATQFQRSGTPMPIPH